jgi:DNA-binding CsgD family transcriptional regulator
MGRTRKGSVLESTEELQALLDRLGSSPYEPRVRFLMAIKEDPRIKSEVLMGVLGLSDRTIRRWWSDYRTAGLATFLHSLESEVARPSVAEDALSYDDGAQHLMEFLNTLPVSCDMAMWTTTVEEALAVYLDDVYRVDLVINGVEGEPRSDQSNASGDARTSGPVLEISIGEGEELGLLRLHGKPGVTFEGAMTMIEELKPFLTFLFTDAIARDSALRPRQRLDSTAVVSGLLAKTLTPRERDVLLHRLYGYSYTDASTQLGVSEETIRKCVKSIYRKTKTSSMGELFVRYFSSLDHEHFRPEE